MEIPVAVPLRVPSTEVRRRREEEMQEEMDISAAVASAPLLRESDSLGISTISTPADLPSAGKFAMRPGNRASSMTDASPSAEPEDNGDIGDNPTSPVSMPEHGQRRNFPSHKGHKTQASEGSASQGERRRSSSKPKDSTGRKRGASITFGSLRRASHPTISYDDDEGDLGFSAAEGLESSTRKVIVERLEAVKSKPPVFTWC